MINKYKVMNSTFQFIKFSLVGIINTLASLFMYYFLISLNLNYIAANITSYFVSSLIGFFLSKAWVFKAKEQNTFSSAMKYYIVYGVSLVINVSCMYFWVELLHISKIVAPLLTMCITVPFNYILSKLWTFKV